MNATRILFVLAGLVPMTTGPLDTWVEGLSAAEGPPVHATMHGPSAGGVAGAVAPACIASRATGAVATPAPPRTITT